jgi:hypothetical protein
MDGESLAARDFDLVRNCSIQRLDGLRLSVAACLAALILHLCRYVPIA